MIQSAPQSYDRSAVRRESDRLASTCRGDRFRRRRLEHTKGSETLVLSAVANAKLGDYYAMRFL